VQNRLDVLNSCRVAGTNVFVVGCLDERITFYAQQVRALNVIDALLGMGGLPPKRARVAVVGGGAAGITAASALALCGPGLGDIHLYETKPNLLHLQRSSNRYLHPHLYDWPHESDTPGCGTLNTRANLPFLSWSAGRAGMIAVELTEEYYAIAKATGLRPILSRRVEHIEVGRAGLLRLAVQGEAEHQEYNAVILTIGFGYEKLMTESSGANKSYWSETFAPGPIVAPGCNHTLFVSGNGDGGLVEFICAAYQVPQSEVCELLTSLPDIAPIKDRLMKIEACAVRRDDFDVFAAYDQEIWQQNLIDNALRQIIHTKLRRDATIILHTNHNHLFNTKSSMLNRFAAFLAIKVSAESERRIEVRKGCNIDTGPQPEGWVELKGRRFRPFLQTLRFGPDRKTNRKPFEFFMTALEQQRRSNAALASARSFDGRLATPGFTAGAEHRFNVGSSWSATSNKSSTDAPLHDIDRTSRELLEALFSSVERPQNSPFFLCRGLFPFQRRPLRARTRKFAVLTRQSNLIKLSQTEFTRLLRLLDKNVSVFVVVGLSPIAAKPALFCSLHTLMRSSLGQRAVADSQAGRSRDLEFVIGEPFKPIGQGGDPFESIGEGARVFHLALIAESDKSPATPRFLLTPRQRTGLYDVSFQTLYTNPGQAAHAQLSAKEYHMRPRREMKPIQLSRPLRNIFEEMSDHAMAGGIEQAHINAILASECGQPNVSRKNLIHFARIMDAYMRGILPRYFPDFNKENMGMWRPLVDLHPRAIEMLSVVALHPGSRDQIAENDATFALTLMPIVALSDHTRLANQAHDALREIELSKFPSYRYRRHVWWARAQADHREATDPLLELLTVAEESDYLRSYGWKLANIKGIIERRLNSPTAMDNVILKLYQRMGELLIP